MWYGIDYERRLKSLNDYANKRYKEIQLNIFKNGGDRLFQDYSTNKLEMA